MTYPIDRDVNDSISLSQVFLPFYNPLDGTEGWQFGMPPVEQDEGSLLSNVDFELSISILTRDGEFYQVPHPIHEQPEGRPPQPVWAWVPVRTESGISYARTVAPEESVGSVSLFNLPQYSRKKFYTQSGLAKTSKPRTPADLPYDIDYRSLEPGTESVYLGPKKIADIKFSEGTVDWISPGMPAFQMDLWTSHVARVVETRARHGEPL